ncbi:MAG: hypothetical protein LBQ22_09225 [Bacteroidales bacterium]|jgi:hypothetical protein|nr:hypothetical protein [Bacteroidales bacterium]
MKKKLTKLNLEAIEKELPCLSKDDARAVVGGDIGDWLRNLWWDVINFWGPRDCAFNSFIYVYNNNAYTDINPFGYQISYREIVNNYIDQYGYPSYGGVNMEIFMKYVNNAYNVMMYQNTDGIFEFKPTNMIAISGEGQSMHIVIPMRIIYDDANGNPIEIEYYDPSNKKTSKISVSQYEWLFDVVPGNFIDSPIEYNYPYDNYNYPYNSYNYYNYYG